MPCSSDFFCQTPEQQYSGKTSWLIGLTDTVGCGVLELEVEVLGVLELMLEELVVEVVCSLATKQCEPSAS